jgi:DNA mismatch repair protein MutS2
MNVTATSEHALREGLPDLLHPVPMQRGDHEFAREALRFAFASGGSDVPLQESFDDTRLAFSTFSPDCFAQDLYLEAFLEQYATLEIGGAQYRARPAPLLRLLSHPPADPAITRFRQAVLEELTTQPAFRASFERAYAHLARFGSLLRDAGLGARLDANRRRVDVLEAARDAIDELARSFEGARSALSRLRSFGLAVQGTQSFERLRSLLAYEDDAASVEVRLRLGHDGQLRHLEITKIQEARLNPFYSSVLGRLVRRIWSLFRGYRFSDAEVLGRFVDEVFTGVEPELVKFFQLLGDMEFYLVALRFRDACARQGLEVCLPEFVGAQPGGTGEERHWQDLFNPLLVVEARGSAREPNKEGARAVPCSLRHRSADIVLLTGPNSGGKTRLLQALSLTQLLGQAGMFVPAARARLVWASAMFLSIGDHADAHQKEGRLGSELLRVRKVFESVRPGAFLVVDELCSGTNPSEGEEIFRMVLSLLHQLSPQAFISTHFLELAASFARSGKGQGLDFLQVELDADSRPTYRFVPGVASTSLAAQTAARLGVTREQLLALIQGHKAHAR